MRDSDYKDSTGRGYSDKTHALIERMCRYAERQDFELDKSAAEELILKTYDLFELPRPRKIIWVDSPFNKIFQEAARSAGLAGSAGLAWSAGLARSAGLAGSAGLARSAWLARSAGLAGSAGLDYDFDYFVMEYEYTQNPEGAAPNENDYKYLEYSELLISAIEAGLGYRVEYEDTLYLAPTPLVRINSGNAFHSTRGPAIRWKGADEFFYLNGVNFPKELFEKVTDEHNPPSAKDILSIEDVDQRTQAMRFLPHGEMIRQLNGEIIDTYQKFDIEGNPVNYTLYKFPKGEIFSEDAYYCLMDCPSTGKQHLEGVEVSKTVAEAQAWAMSNEFVTITSEEWRLMIPLKHEN